MFGLPVSFLPNCMLNSCSTCNVSAHGSLSENEAAKVMPQTMCHTGLFIIPILMEIDSVFFFSSKALSELWPTRTAVILALKLF